jgi:hypothetical protein
VEVLAESVTETFGVYVVAGPTKVELQVAVVLAPEQVKFKPPGVDVML